MAVHRDRFVEPVNFTERDGLVFKRPREVRPQVQGAVEPFQRLLVPTEPLQIGTDIAAYAGIGRIQRLRLPVVGQRLLKSIEVVQRRPR